MKRILVINGPNLNLLGQREPELYGNIPLDVLNHRLRKLGEELELELAFFQSNHEGELIDFLHSEAENALGIIINAGGLSHYSYALRDALTAVDRPVIEVHMTNVAAREQFRQTSVLAPECIGTVSGFGYYGYAMALSYFSDQTQQEEK